MSTLMIISKPRTPVTQCLCLVCLSCLLCLLFYIQMISSVSQSYDYNVYNSPASLWQTTSIIRLEEIPGSQEVVNEISMENCGDSSNWSNGFRVELSKCFFSFHALLQSPRRSWKYFPRRWWKVLVQKKNKTTSSAERARGTERYVDLWFLASF